MTRAALYLRISQDATGEHLGVTRQREDCEELARLAGWDITETYTDNDISAYKLRPGYEKMLADMAAGHIEAVIAWAPDRLYRRVKDLETLIAVIEANGVQVRTVKAGELDLTSAYGRMIARILGSVASGEGEIKAERWKRSWRQHREAGMVARTGSRMFGYDRDGKIIATEAAIARELSARVIRGDGLNSICYWLTEIGVKTTRGSDWTIAGLKRYMLNPRLAGWSTLNGEIVAEGQWEPLLDRETWENVRAILTSRPSGQKRPRVAVLNGMIFCGKCEHRLITSSTGDGKRTYRCPKRPGMMGCGGITGKAEAIEEVVEEYAREALSDPRILDRIATLRAQPDGAQAEIAALELRLTELEQQLDQPGVPVSTVLRAIDRAKTRQGELLEALGRSTITPIPVEDEPWPTDIQRRRALIELVVQRVDLMPMGRPAGRLGFEPERVKITER